MQKKITIFSGIRVGAYCIRPKNDHENGRMNEKMGVLRCIFIRGMGNRVGIGLHFVRGMDFWMGIKFIRPLAWPSVGRIQYAPTLTNENSSGFGFVFIRGIENRMGIGPRFVRGMDFWVGIRFIRPLAWPFVGRIQYAPTLTDENSSGFGFVFIRCRRKSPFFRVSV